MPDRFSETVSRRFATATSAFTRLWRERLPRRGRVFALNVAFGLAAWLLLVPFETNALVENVRDGLLRWQLGLFSGTSLPHELAYVDVDDATYFAWGSPAVTPRDKLCRLIDFAIRARPRAVVVDIDVTARDAAAPAGAVSCDSRAPAGDRTRTSGDNVLAAYLGAYARSCRAGRPPAGRPCVPLIFARTPNTLAWAGTADDPQARRPVLGLPGSFLDAVLGDRFPVFRGSDRFGNDADGVLRRWRLFEPICGPPAMALPSMALLAAAAYNGRDLGELQRRFNATLAPVCVGNGSARTFGRDPPGAVEVDAGRPIVVTAGAHERRFLFRIGWDERDHSSLPISVSAAAITERDAPTRFRNANVAGTVVVIGGSGPDQPDFHRTPLGTMPGSVVVLNAINALLHDDHVRTPSRLQQFAFELLAIAIVALLFTYCRPLVALAVSALVVAALAVTGGVALLDAGYWIDPVAPVLGIGLHEVLARRYRWIEELADPPDHPPPSTPEGAPA